VCQVWHGRHGHGHDGFAPPFRVTMHGLG
jgi:hypothetical protein